MVSRPHPEGAQRRVGLKKQSVRLFLGVASDGIGVMLPGTG